MILWIKKVSWLSFGMMIYCLLSSKPNYIEWCLESIDVFYQHVLTNSSFLYLYPLKDVRIKKGYGENGIVIWKKRGYKWEQKLRCTELQTEGLLLITWGIKTGYGPEESCIMGKGAITRKGYWLSIIRVNTEIVSELEMIWKCIQGLRKTGSCNDTGIPVVLYNRSPIMYEYWSVCNFISLFAHIITYGHNSSNVYYKSITIGLRITDHKYYILIFILIGQVI